MGVELRVTMDVALHWAFVGWYYKNYNIKKSGQCLVLNMVVFRGTCIYQMYEACRHAKLVYSHVLKMGNVCVAISIVQV